MKKVTFILSGIAITATVGVTMAQTLQAQQYCIAYTRPSGPTGPREAFPYDGINSSTLNTCSLTVFARQINPDETPDVYGFQKITLECPHVQGCDALVKSEF